LSGFGSSVGKVESANRKCISGRTVEISRRPPGGGAYRLIDSDQSSRNGFWSGGGFENISSIDGKVTVKRKVVSSPGGQIVCAAAVDTFD
jgi:hypothetical protein